MDRGQRPRLGLLRHRGVSEAAGHALCRGTHRSRRRPSHDEYRRRPRTSRYRHRHARQSAYRRTRWPTSRPVRARPCRRETTLSSENGADTGNTAPRLGRVLGLRDLIFYGIVIIQPIAAIPVFGVTHDLSRGHAVTAVLIAGIAMMLTGYSYGRMAAMHPAAGSAYSYVGRGLNPHLGFLAGWAMALDYLIFPIVALIQASLTIERLIPAIPYPVWVTGFVVLLTGINLIGIRATARANTILLAAMFAVIGIFIYCASTFIVGADGAAGLISSRPFYDPQT